MDRPVAASVVGKLVLCVSFATTAAETNTWSEFSTGKVSQSDPDEYAVTILAIDGRENFKSKRSHKVAPGFHLLHVASTKTGRRGDVTYQPFAIEMAPCIRYELVARHERRLSNQRWQVVVKNEKPIVSCRSIEAPQADAAPPTS